MKFKHCLSFLMAAAIMLCMIFHGIPSVYAAPSMTESVQAGKPALGENRGIEACLVILICKRTGRSDKGSVCR